MTFTLFTSDCTGVESNCYYPHAKVITEEEELREAVRMDHVCAKYRNNRRSSENFIRSDCLVMDIDNDHSEDESKWITEKKIEELFGDVDYALAASRHHMLPKDGKSARPRFHVYFPIMECTDAKFYTALKVAIQERYPFFDNNALDSARFIYGARSETVILHDGWCFIDDLIIPDESTSFGYESDGSNSIIHEGSRNSTMSHFAGRVLKRYGNTDKAHQAFLDHARKCDPPLESDELERIWGSAVRFFNKKISGSDGYIPPEEYNADFESLKPTDFSDIGEARVLTREYANELIYTSATEYLRYDGCCWLEDKQLAIGAVEEFMDLQLEEVRDQIQEATSALKKAGVSEDLIKAGGTTLAKAVTGNMKSMQAYFKLLSALAYEKFVMKHRDYKYIVSTANAAKPMLNKDVGELDQNEFLLNTPKATYDLRKGMDGEMPHDPYDYITKMTACSPGEEGADLWQDALDLFFCKDQELIDYVQRIVGLAAIGKVYQEHMIIAYGDGANGKSTFWNTIFRVLGSYAGKISADTLTLGCKRNVKPEMAELKGKRLIIASEMEEGMRLNTATVKQLCSTDEIEAEKKYKDPFHFTPSHSLVLYTNYLPKVGANDDGIWRRLIVIPFHAKITGKKDIKNYTEYLYDHAGPSILQWIIEGSRKVIADGYTTKLPAVVVEAVRKYREDNDWFGQFIGECCDVDPALEEKSGQLYQSYRGYCIQNGEYIRSTSDFYTALEMAGFVRKRTRSGVKVSGLQLKDGQDFLE